MAETLEVNNLEIPLSGDITFSYKGGGAQLHAGFIALATLIGDSASKLYTRQHTIGKLSEDAVREIASLLRGAESNLTDLLTYLALPREKRKKTDLARSTQLTISIQIATGGLFFYFINFEF